MSDTKVYNCKSPVRHDGELYTKTVELTDKQAEPLLKVGAITLNLEANEAAEEARLKAEADKKAADDKAAKEKAEADKKAEEDAAKAEAENKVESTEEQQEIKLPEPEAKPETKSKGKGKSGK